MKSGIFSRLAQRSRRKEKTLVSSSMLVHVITTPYRLCTVGILILATSISMRYEVIVDETYGLKCSIPKI